MRYELGCWAQGIPMAGRPGTDHRTRNLIAASNAARFLSQSFAWKLSGASVKAVDDLERMGFGADSRIDDVARPDTDCSEGVAAHLRFPLPPA